MVPKTTALSLSYERMKAQQLVTILLESKDDWCPLCRGSGTAIIRSPGGFFKSYHKEMRCPACKGSGRKKQPETSDKIPPKAMMMAVTGGSDFPIAGGGQG